MLRLSETPNCTHHLFIINVLYKSWDYVYDIITLVCLPGFSLTDLYPSDWDLGHSGVLR